MNTSVRAKISVVIPSFDQANELRETLDALSKQTIPSHEMEVIVVDDGSRDQTADVLSQSIFPYSLRLLTQRNRGAAAARNLGARQAHAEIVLFLDADMIADRDLVRAHMEGHSQRADILVAGARRTWQPVRRSGFSTVIDIDTNIPNDPALIDDLDVGKAYSCNLSLRRSDWQRLSGFDERFPASGFEDFEFVYRAGLNGMKVIFNPQAIAYHNHPISIAAKPQSTA